MRVKEEDEKTGLKHNVQKTEIVGSSPITSQHINREKVEIVTDFTFLGSNITVSDAVTAAMKLKDTCSLEEKL